jgi:hypothetical protein
MVRENETDGIDRADSANGDNGIDDTRGPLALDASPVDASPVEHAPTEDDRRRYDTDGRRRYDTATPRARRLRRFLDETRTGRTDG